MLTKKKSKPKTISEKMVRLISKQNGDENSEESAEESFDAPRVIDFDDDEYELPSSRSTEIRKRNVKLLSKQSDRYKGKIASRKDFEDEQSEESEEETSDEEEYDNISMNLDDEDENSDDDVSQSSDCDDDDDIENSDISENEGNNVEYNKDDECVANKLKETNQQAELQKGACVQSQLEIWERLLELRIHSQKLISKANQLPPPKNLQEQISEDQAVREASQETITSTGSLIKCLLQLQEELYKGNTELKSAMKNSLKRSSPFAGHKKDVPPSKRLTEELDINFKEFRDYRNKVLLKWNDRTKLLTPGAGTKKKSINEEYDIIQKIENSLLNKKTLIEKSQIAKNSCQTDSTKVETSVGDTSSSKHNVDIYDDSDFYHQQLRELIEYKSNSTNSKAEVTRQYVELQKLRQKMKKKVETRASKGRKIRYTVHNKLVNFMAPQDNSNWTDDSRNELYKSLFAS